MLWQIAYFFSVDWCIYYLLTLTLFKGQIDFLFFSVDLMYFVILTLFKGFDGWTYGHENESFMECNFFGSHAMANLVGSTYEYAVSLSEVG